jgi:hypothetical protein
VLVLVPSIGIAAAVLWFCLSRGKPLYIPAAVLVVLFFIVDHFAYGTFCEIAVTQDGLLYRGGGLLWKGVRKERTLPWANYVYILIPAVPLPGRLRWESLEVWKKPKCDAGPIPGILRWACSGVAEKAECEAGGVGSKGAAWPTLAFSARTSAYSEFSALAHEVLMRNPEVRVKYTRPRRSPRASTVTVGKVDISGDDEFRKRTIDALCLLKERDPVNYARIQRYIVNIASVESKFYGVPVTVDFETATIEVYRQTSLLTAPRGSYALEIVKQMCRYMLRHRFKVSAYSPKNVRERREICYRAQLRSLRRLRAPEAAIQHFEETVEKRLPEPEGQEIGDKEMVEMLDRHPFVRLIVKQILRLRSG